MIMKGKNSQDMLSASWRSRKISVDSTEDEVYFTVISFDFNLFF